MKHWTTIMTFMNELDEDLIEIFSMPHLYSIMELFALVIR